VLSSLVFGWECQRESRLKYSVETECRFLSSSGPCGLCCQTRVAGSRVVRSCARKNHASRAQRFLPSPVKPDFSLRVSRAMLPAVLPVALFIIHNVVDFDRYGGADSRPTPRKSTIPTPNHACEPERGKVNSPGRPPCPKFEKAKPRVNRA